MFAPGWNQNKNQNMPVSLQNRWPVPGIQTKSAFQWDHASREHAPALSSFCSGI